MIYIYKLECLQQMKIYIYIYTMYTLIGKLTSVVLENIASLGAELRAPLSPHKYHITVKVRRVLGDRHLGPMMPRHASPSESCTSDRCFFQVWLILTAGFISHMH